ncbi:MAG: histidinol-phosphate transaminase [Fibrobacter sp.]|jgi:histidinol-phosphate aminotransferase|nr:histidinol-phosphate transaminase [Fibrobacter sp.]
MVEPRPELSKLSDYVPGKSIEEIRERYGLDRVVKLASNENPLGASPKAVEAFHQIADSLHLYPRGDAPKLIDAIAKKYSVKTSQIIIGNGSDEIIDMVGKAFIRQGDNCVGITPTFSVYKFTTLSNGADFIGVGEGEAKTSLAELAKAIDGNTRVVFICSPNNPTGHYYSDAEIRDFMKMVPQNVLVFLDEAYAEFATATDFPKTAALLKDFPNLFVNRTFSKIYGLAGLRIGYAMSSEDVVRAMWKIKPPFDVNQAAQVAAVAALGDADHVEATRALNAAGIKMLTAAFEGLGFKVLPTQGNFICVRIGERAKELVGFLEQNGMIVRGLTSFGMPEYIRVTIGKAEENEFLVALVKKWVG